MKNILFLLLICFFIGCTSTNKKQEKIVVEANLAEINLSENVSKVGSIPLSDAVEKVKIVPLETTDESMLGDIQRVQVTQDDIWVKPEGDEQIYRFTFSGEFLNKVGKKGQGPEEYSYIGDYHIDNVKKEIYIISVSQGVFVYDFKGKFLRKVADGQTVSGLFSCQNIQYQLFNNNFFTTQNLVLFRPIPKDSLWSFASLDSTFHVKKLFSNPVYKGREEQILANGADMTKMVNYWVEYPTNMDIYDNQLTLKYPDTDTIYRYDETLGELLPQFSISSKEKKGDYEATHLWFPERESFNYFSIFSYYPSKDFIYLVGSKGDKIYIYSYNKLDGSVKMQEYPGEITERKVPWFDMPLRRMQRPFVLKNDLCGGDFQVKYRSSGKYWVDVLMPYSELNHIDINGIKLSTVKDEKNKQEFIKVLEDTHEDSNPILVVAVLK